MREHIPSLDILNQIEDLLRYDPHTGLLRYRVFFRSYRPGDIAGHSGEDGYCRVSIGGRSWPAHHVSWFLHTGQWPDLWLELDHRNRVRSDNRIDNLRLVDRETNQANRSIYATNKSGHVGIHQRGDHWVAQISYGGRKHHIGTYQTLEEAVQMRVAIVKELHA